MAKANGASFMDLPQFAEFEKVLGAFKLPMVEGSQVVEMQRKNVEALSEANKVVFEGWQALAQRQGELMRQSVEGFAAGLRDVADSGSFEEGLAKQTTLVKDGFEQAVANVRELGELGVKSQNAAVEVLNHRFVTGLDEFKTAIETSAKGK